MSKRKSRKKTDSKAHESNKNDSVAARDKRSSEPNDDQQNNLAMIVEKISIAFIVAMLVVSALITSDSIPHLGTSLGVVMFWMLALCAWIIAGVFRGWAKLRFGAVDLAVLALLLVHVASAAMTIANESGNARASINMTWRWTSLIVAYFLLRQIIQTPFQRRAICAVMIALSVGLSSYGAFQAFYVNPARKAEYNHVVETETEEGVKTWFKQMGLPYYPPGSPQRRHVVDRIIALEPSATFALTNSLGAFLTPWILLTIGIGLGALRDPTLRQRTLIAASFICVIIALCLLFTKSRTSWIATVFGAGLLTIYFWRAVPCSSERLEHRLDWKLPAIALGVVAALVVVAFSAGGLDSLVVSESFKSLSYRLEYWQSSWQMIGDQPWLGCGPGCFKENYTLHKLPQASETIGDPHNFVLEIWVTAGSLGLLAMLSVLGLTTYQLFKRQTGTESANSEKNQVAPFFGGAVVGLLFSFPVGMLIDGMPNLGVVVVGLPAGIAVIVLLRPWIDNGKLVLANVAICFVAFSLNLLGAGGIGFVGVATTWWLLLAVMISYADQSERVVNRAALLVMLCFAFLLTFACQQTAFFPTVGVKTSIYNGEVLQSRDDLIGAEDQFGQAAEEDPYSHEPLLRLTAISLQQWFRSGGKSDATFERFEGYIARLRKLSPKNHGVRMFEGNLYLQAYQVHQDAALLDKAVASFRAAVKLYPSSNFHHAQLAWTLDLAGDHQAAAESAKIALELDELNPHLEKRLKHRRIEQGKKVKNAENAEQMMHKIRKSNGD